MSEKAESPKKRATANPSKSVTEDMPPATPRKRRTGRTVAKTPAAYEARHVASLHTEPTSRETQGHRSNTTQSTALERQRQRHPDLPAQRRIPMDIAHRSRRSNMSNPGSRPLRTRRSSVASGPPRTMLQHAWHTILNSDPLVDSDEECPDEHLRLDYNRRMQVIARLRGRPPTPEPACIHPVPT